MISNSQVIHCLYHQYKELLLKFEISENHEELFSNILKSYSHPNRYYHNLNHIYSGLKELEIFSSHIFINELTFAWFYHDFIYSVQEKNNEEKSAQYSTKLLLMLGLNKEFAKRVFDLIIITKHQNKAVTEEEKIICDIDLSILGQEQAVFLEYDTNIRKEYSHVPINEYDKKRKDLLQSFLNLPNIYYTPQFQRKYEDQARQNIIFILDTRYV